MMWKILNFSICIFWLKLPEAMHPICSVQCHGMHCWIKCKFSQRFMRLVSYCMWYFKQNHSNHLNSGFLPAAASAVPAPLPLLSRQVAYWFKRSLATNSNVINIMYFNMIKLLSNKFLIKRFSMNFFFFLFFKKKILAKLLPLIFDFEGIKWVQAIKTIYTMLTMIVLFSRCVCLTTERT